MIFEGLCLLVKVLLNAILSLLDVLPDFPPALVKILNDFFDLIFDNIYLISWFVHIDVIKIIIPLVIVVMNFEHVYRFIMWILRKIPMLGID